MRSPFPLVIVAALAACGRAEPAGGADAAASATASSSAAAVTPAAMITDAGTAEDAGDGGPPRPPPPRVRTLEVPEEAKSPLPKNDEWKDIVRRDVAVRAEYTCTLQRLREWHRIECNCSNGTGALVTGTRDGVLFWAAEDSTKVIFPVRRGDRRVMQIIPHDKMVHSGGHYGGFHPESGGPPIVFSETWLDGEDAPTLVMQ